MASAVNSTSSSLPAKKRKTSNASSTTSYHRDSGTAGSGAHPAGVNSTTTTTTRSTTMRDRDMTRLPSKKRKGSHDFSQASNHPKFHAAAATAADDSAVDMRLLHKESIDSSLLLESLPSSRKLSDTSSGLKTLDELFHSPKNNSRDDVHFIGASVSGALQLTSLDASALDHLEALGPAPVATTNGSLQIPTTENAPDAAAAATTASSKRKNSVDDNSSAATMASSGQRLLLEAIMMASQSDSQCEDRGSSLHHLQLSTLSASRRDRLESWGGMSDISMPHVDTHHTHSQQHRPLHTVTTTSHHQAGAADTSHLDDEESKSNAIPSRIALTRDREFSIASLSEVSAFNIPSFGDGELTVSGAELQAYVAAAVASMGDQLAELAGAVESAAGPASVDYESRDASQEGSETSSVLSNLMIGATSDNKGRGRLRSWSTGSGMISVDLDAVQAAVDAAQAASAGLDLTNAATNLQADVDATVNAVPSQNPDRRSESRIRNTKRKLPLKRSRAESAGQNSVSSYDVINSACLSEREIDEIRERTKASLHSAGSSMLPGSSAQPLKKRGRRKAPSPDDPQSSSICQATPRVSNKHKREQDDEMLPIAVPSSDVVAPKQKGGRTGSTADRKWDEMYSCMLEFIADRQELETKNMSPKEKTAWVWDGHVPTNYKKDGKALGRWINNQRSAKGKGALREDREDRLVAAGLKWSVATSNAWNVMFNELRIYISEQTAAGREWNGNVPASYQIKRTKNVEGQDLLLGRWVNRQRSLYQAGGLKKDRQLKLEEIGLKWSMLVSTTWESMFDSLVEYVDGCTRDGIVWDGNVATQYRTNEDPPRALGRWVNRQRCAYAKDTLKKEYVDKLTQLGLKWSIHGRWNDNVPDEEDDESDAEMQQE